MSGLWPLYYKIKIKPRPTGNRWPGAKWCHSKNGRGLIASANKLQTTSGRRQTPKVVAIISGTLLGWLRDWQSEFVISQASFSQLLEQGMHSLVPLLPPQHVQQNVTKTTMPMPMQRRCILSRRHSYLWKTRANSSFHFSFIIYLCAHTFIYVCWQFCYTCCQPLEAPRRGRIWALRRSPHCTLATCCTCGPRPT